MCPLYLIKVLTDRLKVIRLIPIYFSFEGISKLSGDFHPFGFSIRFRDALQILLKRI